MLGDNKGMRNPGLTTRSSLFARPTRSIIVVLSAICLLGFFLVSVRDRTSLDAPIINEHGMVEQYEELEVVKSIIGKVTYVRQQDAEDLTYERSMTLQQQHNKRFGYPIFILNEPLLEGSWTKPMWMLNILTQEMAKAKKDRLEWLVWVDGDVTIMNTNVPLEAFLPPKDTYGHINLVVCNGEAGLSNAVFYLRVNSWSMQFLATVLAMETYEPDTRLKHGSSTAMELWILSDIYRQHVIHVPQRWFSAQAGEWTGILERTPDVSRLKNPDHLTSHRTIQPGDLLVHHVNNPETKRARMELWLRLAEGKLPDWDAELDRLPLKEEINAFWTSEGRTERDVVDKLIVASGAKRSRVRNLDCEPKKQPPK